MSKIAWLILGFALGFAIVLAFSNRAHADEDSDFIIQTCARVGKIAKAAAMLRDEGKPQSDVMDLIKSEVEPGPERMLDLNIVRIAYGSDTLTPDEVEDAAFSGCLDGFEK